ncbi:MAG: NADH:ubiquinone reductase (Na(+)-transporting) subunit B [Candidatus Marinimicrobia bacterium]|nr:NADH:ubiquinone reductase (Na(+)-transporting) subunit B [Candidatus Neomarinimicrobiota bacterium]
MVLRKFLDNIEEKILSSNKLKKFHPLHDALDTFLYTKNTQTLSAPYVRDSIDLKRTMIIVVLALLPSLIFGTYNVGLQSPENTSTSFIDCFIYGLYRVLPMYLVVFAAGGLCEALFAVVRKHEINEGFLVTGFLIPLTMPPTVPLWMLALSTVFGVVIGKEIFGGTGYNIFNPALTARAFLFFAYPSKMSGNVPWIFPADGLSKATPLLETSSSSTLSYSWSDMFFGFIPGSIGETSTIAVLVGAFILILTRIASWRTMVATTIGMIFTSLLLNQIGKIDGTSPMLDITPTYHFVMGSFAFGMVFMATDPVSSAHTNLGRWYYGLLIGFMVVIIRCINPAYPEGMMLAILFANAFAPLFDYNVIQKHIKKREILYEK